jgi:hypothetical protein
MANAVVAPRTDGDTPLQNFNTTLAVQWMQVPITIIPVLVIIIIIIIIIIIYIFI